MPDDDMKPSDPVQEAWDKQAEQSRYTIPLKAQTQSIITAMGMVLPHADVALREDRHLQRRMRDDPDIAAPLDKRTRAVSSLAWEIEPENADEPQQVAEARAIERAIEHVQYLPQMLRCLARASWFGDAVVQVQYDRLVRPIIGQDQDGRATAQVEWAATHMQPIQSDSVAFDYDGNMVILVGAGSKIDMGEVITTPMGRGVRLTPMQRARIIHVVMNIEPPDYLDAREAANVFKGRGLRSSLWYAWWLKQCLMQNGARFLERFGQGIMIGTYPAGNAEARDALDQAMHNIMSDNVTLLPVDPNKEGSNVVGNDSVRIEIKEPTGTGHELVMAMMELLRMGILKVIQGQTLTTETGSTGLGSGVSEEHAQSFREIVEDDAKALAEGLTRDLVLPMARVNFPNSQWRPRFRFILPDDDEARMEKLERFIKLGGEVAEDEAREIAGLREPKDGEPVLGGASVWDSAMPDDEDALRRAVGG